MSDTLQSGASTSLVHALDVLVNRGTITAEQRGAILAEVARTAPAGVILSSAAPPVAGGPTAPAAAPAGPAVRPRRTLSEILIEVGLYVGSALVVAALVVLAAQNWESMGRGAQIAFMAGTAGVTGAIGLVLAGGSQLGTARRRLAGVLLVGTAASSAGTVAVVLEDYAHKETVALAVGLAVLVVANLVASSAVTELGMFVMAYALIQVTIEDFRPSMPVDQWGNESYEPSTYEQLTPLIAVAFGLFWALVVARRMVHREVAVFLGMGVALISALPVIAEQETRPIGMAVMAVLAAVGFWRFLVETYWPWLAAAIASVTALVFFAVGGAHRPALAILVAGLVLLGSSALGMQVGRRRRTRAEHELAP